jgi:hypothetical protein
MYSVLNLSFSVLIALTSYMASSSSVSSSLIRSTWKSNPRQAEEERVLASELLASNFEKFCNSANSLILLLMYPAPISPLIYAAFYKSASAFEYSCFFSKALLLIIRAYTVSTSFKFSSHLISSLLSLIALSNSYMRM